MSADLHYIDDEGAALASAIYKIDPALAERFNLGDLRQHCQEFLVELRAMEVSRGIY